MWVKPETLSSGALCLVPQLLSSIPECYLEAVGKLPGECANVDMPLLRIP